MDRAKFEITSEMPNYRLDRFVKKQLPAASKGEIEKFLRKNLVKLNDKKAAAATNLEIGDFVTIASFLFEKFKDDKKKPQNFTQDELDEFASWIIYEHEHFFAINKPINLPSQGGKGIVKSVDELAKAHGEQHGFLAKLVHRLDGETSGVMLIAKTDFGAASLSQLFKEKSTNDAQELITKKYVAFVAGEPKQKIGEINLKINNKPAKTRYEVIDFLKWKLALINFWPETGRKHQIRIHALHGLGFPIVGDRKYGDILKSEELLSELHFKGQSALFLHAQKLEFSFAGKKINIEAKLPRHFELILNEIK